jgi:hypothetical protein
MKDKLTRIKRVKIGHAKTSACKADHLPEMAPCEKRLCCALFLWPGELALFTEAVNKTKVYLAFWKSKISMSTNRTLEIIVYVNAIGSGL